MADAIQECQTMQDISDTLDVVFFRFIKTYGHHTFPDKQLNKDFVKLISRAFKDKVEDLKENETLESIVKYTVDRAFDKI